MDATQTAFSAATTGVVAEDNHTPLLALHAVYARNQDVVAYDVSWEATDDSGDRNKGGLSRLNAQLMAGYSATRQGPANRVVPTVLKLTSDVLDEDLPELPRTHYIVEVAWQANAETELIHALRRLADQGYRLSISGLAPGCNASAELLGLVHMARLDIARLGLSNALQVKEELRHYSLDLLASNLQGRDQFKTCFEAGFHLFSGDLFGKPVPTPGRRIGNNKVVLLQLLAELQKTNASVGNLEAIAIKAPELAYRILRVVSSASVGLGRQIETLSQAIAMLGTEQLRRWVVLFLVDSEDNRPLELTRVMLVRGRMCELLAEILGRDMTLGHFMAGLLSQLDVLVDMPMKELLEQVPLNTEIRNALLERKGSPGEILAEVEHYEAGRFDALKNLVPRSYYEVAYRHSTVWAEQALRALEGSL